MRPALSASLLLLMVASAANAAADEDGLDLKVYGDVNFQAFTHTPVSSSFAAGQLDLFPTYSKDRTSFLAELVFEGDNNEIGVDLERVQASYLVTDWLRVKAGRFHTAFGYYNDAYHHGKLFELATGRPTMVSFEDQGGMLQAHLVGVAADGKFALGPADLHYDVEIGNGRGRLIEEVTLSDARKSSKALNVRLRLLPSFADGLTLGANLLYDFIPPTEGAGPATPGLTHQLTEITAGVHVAYMEHGYHFIAEGAYIQHRESDTGLRYDNWAGFVELGRALGDFTPYVRFERVSLDGKGDPLYQQSTLLDARFINDGRVGAKWLVNENLALKLEAGTYQSFVVPSRQTLRVQCAFGF